MAESIFSTIRAHEYVQIAVILRRMRVTQLLLPSIHRSTKAISCEHTMDSEI